MIDLEYNYDKLLELRGMEPYTFANWKAIMEFVGAPPTLDGNSKRKFQNKVKRYLDFHKDGYRIVIDKVKDSVEPEINIKGSKYQKYSVEVLKRVLKETTASDFSVLKLAELLGCVNKDYSYAYSHRRNTAKKLGVDKGIVEDFFNATHSQIKRIVESALDKLVGVGLIEYQIRLKGIYVSGDVVLNLKYDDERDEECVSGNTDIKEGYRFLNDQEVEIYEQEKCQLMQKYKVNSERELYTKRKNVAAFYREFNKSVFEKVHIRNVYKAYVITRKMEYETVSEVEKATFMLYLNDMVTEGVTSSTDKKQRERLEEIELYKDALELKIVEDEEGVRRSNEWRAGQVEKNMAKYTLIENYLAIKLE